MNAGDETTKEASSQYCFFPHSTHRKVKNDTSCWYSKPPRGHELVAGQAEQIDAPIFTHSAELEPCALVVSIMLCKLFLLFFFASIHRIVSHEESGEWSCDSNLEIRVESEFNPGLITLDGHADDWKDVDGFEFALLPALDPHVENEYKAGKLTVKVVFVIPNS